ncbi:MAG: AtpZ/AtpI family protein [Acidobacteria bacterium]|nr:AtpZ/AtpI family protein [Acidobacteriota bacterium]
MPRKLEQAMRAFQENVQRAGPAATASYTLIGGILLLGGLGYAYDAWRGHGHGGLLVGLFTGIAVGFYEIVMSTRRGPQ